MPPDVSVKKYRTKGSDNGNLSQRVKELQKWHQRYTNQKTEIQKHLGEAKWLHIVHLLSVWLSSCFYFLSLVSVSVKFPFSPFQLIDVSWTVNKEDFIAKNGEWILANINCIGYYRVNYNPENWERLLAQLQKNRHVSTGPLQFYTFYWVIFTGNITTSYLLKLLCSIPGNKCRDFVSYWLIIKIKSNYIYINWQGYIEEK